ncbi:MAG: hypothetical protein IPM60_14315 [Rhodospirillales bacterium]|nr:hypothetical protein [Rhodospirillales bacterium]
MLAWRLSNTLDAGFCVEALEEALMRFGPPADGVHFSHRANVSPYQLSISGHFSAACHRANVGAGEDVMPSARLWLTVWFWAAYLMATHSNGMSARQLWRRLGLGSTRSASCWTKDDSCAGGHGRSGDDKLPLAGAGFRRRTVWRKGQGGRRGPAVARRAGT